MRSKLAGLTSDIERLTENLRAFRWDVPEYSENQSELPESFKSDEPRELIPLLRTMLRDRGARLARDSAAADGNIRASADLRQSIANTRMQRAVLALTVAAVVIAVISVLLG